MLCLTETYRFFLNKKRKEKQIKNNNIKEQINHQNPEKKHKGTKKPKTKKL
jgi:hypothetical protein